VIEVNPITKEPLPYPPDQRKAKQIPLLFVNNVRLTLPPRWTPAPHDVRPACLQDE
jgi:hypothetical protein